MSTQSLRVFITGGASGLGHALAKACLARGARVCIADISEPAEPLDGVLYLPCDVTELAQLEAAADTLSQRWGGVDWVFNNAGVAQVGPIETVSMDDWHWIIQINLLGVVRGCKAFTPMLKRQGHGHIINVASMAGLLDVANMSSYNATKAAVVSLSETLHNELAPHGVGVSVVCPSFFRTNLGQAMRSTIPNMDKSLDKLMQKSPLNADDVAALILRAVDRKQFYILPHAPARRLWLAKRLLPRNWYVRLVRKGGKPGGNKKASR